MSDIGQNIVKGVKWTSISSVTNAVVKLIQVSVLAHILSPDAFGLIAIAYIFLSFADIIVDMGLTTAILHFQDINHKQYSTIFWVNIILGVLTASIIFTASWLIEDYYHNEEIRPIIQLLSVNIFILSISRLHKTFLQKQMDFKSMSIIEIIGAGIMSISAILFAISGFGVYSLIFSALLSSTIITILFLINVKSLNSQLSFYISIRGIKEFYSIGIYQFLSSIVEFFSRETDTMFISSYFSIELLGYYTLCKQLAQRLYNIINPIIIKVAVPTLAKIQNDKLALTNVFTKMIRFSSSVNFPIYGILYILAPPILVYLYGSQYLSQVSILRIFSIYYALMSVGSFTGVLTITLGNTKIGMYWSIYRVLSMIFVCFVAKDFSFINYIFSITIGVTLINFYIGYRMTVKKFIPLKFIKYLFSQLNPLIITIVACMLVSLYNYGSQINIAYYVLKLSIFIIIYLGLTLIFNTTFSKVCIQYVKR